ncbi:ATP-dependent DNA helicase RecG [Sedimentibacter sp. zth1]|uniref:ATP-dependent DNA helicase RecG n=1 Tax=Sedimentibacter sp. zth1 TaxID=2816908 RepID=UPI001F5FBDA4|nr:ATP-dependent DNA helicase RecG [Sedimentibacter sp. zth1]
MINTNVKYLKGVGPKRALKLNRLDIYTVEDLLNYFPTKYEDRRKISNIIDVENDIKVLLRVKILKPPTIRKVNKKMSIIKVIASDDTSYITITFFNQDFLFDKLILNQYFYLFGKCKRIGSNIEMINPDIENVNESVKSGRIMPIYALTNSLTNNELTKLIMQCMRDYSAYIENILPNEIIDKYNLLNKKDAIRYLHFPPDGKKYTLAKKTIAFEKLLVLEIGLLSIKSKLNLSGEGIVQTNTSLSDKLFSNLPFKLTNAQLRVVDEIKLDMQSNKPMNRLIQGDVGSGKTIVAIIAMLISVSSGYQASMMAPTEILAMQHYQTIKEYLDKSGISLKVEFLSGSTTKKKKTEILRMVKNNEIDILIGTHALIEKNVEFNNIGLAITDEQHRFGVRQRAMLSNKGKNPDILVMTATPIPRTLALMIYGDLDISIIDEMPPNRQQIITKVIKGNDKEEAYEFIKKRIYEGRQAYIVAPLIEESETMELDSASEIYEKLKNDYFKEFNLGLLHGKMTNKEKDEIMDKFYNGEINVLVSTTVIEVGVDVPNSVVMLILNAERFGLAQLHQLRGRVGRGQYQSFCILVNESKSKHSKARMQVLQDTNNGFLIAEEDLKIRGPGDFFGSRQHGVEKYNIENLIQDIKIVQNVQLLTKDLLTHNPSLIGEEYKALKDKILKLFDKENIVFN